MHVIERLAEEGLMHWKMPNCEAGVSVWAAVSGNYFPGLLPWNTQNHFASHWTFTVSTLGHLDIILLFSFPFPVQVMETCCAPWRKIRRPPLHTHGSHNYQTRLTCETVVRRKVVLRGRETEGSGCARRVTTVEMPVHRVSVLLTFPPPAECLMLSLEPHRDWISLKSIFLFKILT